MVDATLTLTFPPHDYDGDGNTRTAKFVLTDNLRLSFRNRMRPLIDSGGNIIGALGQLYAALTGEDIDGFRQNFSIDLGGGEHVVEVEGQVVKDSPNQWGTGDGDETWDKTGAHPLEQAQLLDRCFQIVKIDSVSPATLSIGMYGNEFDALDVKPEDPEEAVDFEQESSTATVSMNLVELASISSPVSQIMDNR